MSKKKEQRGMDRRSFIKMASGAVIAVSGNWFLPRISLGADDEIRIGGLCEMSGPASTVGVEQSQGIELAVDMYNRNGGVLGKKLKLFMEDTESKKDVGLSKARRLVERRKVHFLTGIIFSSISMAIQPYARDKKIIFVNSGSGNDLLVRPPYCNRYFFKGKHSATSDTLGVRVPARSKGPKWFFSADDYSFGKLVIKFEKKAIKMVKPDFQVVGEEYTPFGETNYAPYLTKVMVEKPDVFCVNQFGAGWSRVIKQARQMGIKCHIHHLFFSYNDAMAAGDAVLGMTGSAAFFPGNPDAPKARIFSDAFKEKYGHYPGWAGADGFSGVELIIEAAKLAGTIETETLIDTMENMIYENSIWGPKVFFRKGDHMAVKDKGYVVEVVKDPEYKYRQKIIGSYEDGTLFLPPEGNTGCEDAMKKG
jgi:branched-chain amino acid transport system substrate-binding protein